MEDLPCHLASCVGTGCMLGTFENFRIVLVFYLMELRPQSRSECEALTLSLGTPLSDPVVSDNLTEGSSALNGDMSVCLAFS